MKYACSVLLVLVFGIPLLIAGPQSDSKQPGIKKFPVAVSGDDVGLKNLPLAITDKAAVDEWSKSIYDGPLDPKAPSDTAFLLTLNDFEMLGRFRFRQRCAVCHATQSNGDRPMGPLLSRDDVIGHEDAIRLRILEGSARMPGFKATIEPQTVNAIIAYLTKVEPGQEGRGMEIESSSLRMEERPR